MKRVRDILVSTKLWTTAFLLWLSVICILSSLSNPLPDEVSTIPYIDKILHFGYFFCGVIILILWISLRKPYSPKTLFHYAFPVLLMALVGLLDEYRQTFTPGRSGNDFFDWTADFSGALAGTILINQLRKPIWAFLGID